MGILKRGLIVSCQATPAEPLHSPEIMGRLAIAAKGGFPEMHIRTRQLRTRQEEDDLLVLRESEGSPRCFAIVIIVKIGLRWNTSDLNGIL